MSSAFARLREWLGDPLLVKGKGGLTLTPRAEELVEPLRRIMADLEQTFAVDLRLFAHPDFRHTSFATFLFGISFIMMFLGNLVFLQQVWRYSLVETALGFAPGALAIIPAAMASGRLTNRYGPRTLIFVGASIFAAGGAWFWLFLSASPDYAGT